jgi:hypothetical protein
MGSQWLWDIINNVPILHNAAILYFYTSMPNKLQYFIQFKYSNCLTVRVNTLFLGTASMIDSPPRYNSGYDYITTESHFNTSYYARTLPPVPKHCPTPMGVAGNLF